MKTPSHRTGPTTTLLLSVFLLAPRCGPAVPAYRIRVAADQGVVTLTGSVDTATEKLDAAENAYEGGAIRAENRLEVRH